MHNGLVNEGTKHCVVFCSKYRGKDAHNPSQKLNDVKHCKDMAVLSHEVIRGSCRSNKRSYPLKIPTESVNVTHLAPFWQFSSKLFRCSCRYRIGHQAEQSF